ncbi:MAG TPA: secondary thiamine-phosphate synthase enzyme YjbQ [Spirochaetota bacterium]|nr:secondary thiamine-phosphate synthase enzyme YjbQ [Spirochaetota bacterium]HOM09926.1 secondary thiamine-phosphate synthase enzyme YjbQ [Spirochaetota bacterium]HPP48635.1 secondary thiamine-phosphate synthase enzyme YjbQ [Spirochaetota bacterium]
MAVITGYISIATQGQGDIIDITLDAQKIVTRNKIQDGLLCLFVPGSTAAITTIEFEPGLQKDINLFLEKIIPRNAHYHHHDTWHDDNGSSHLRASMIGPSITVPIVDGTLTLGTWQQIVVIECDTRKRNRKIVAQIVY